MFTKVEEIWWEPFASAFENGDDVPEIVRRVNEASFAIGENYQLELTDEERLLQGIDPDMVNEFCAFTEDEWSEIEKHYQDVDGFYSTDNAEIVGTKQARARKIQAGIDPETDLPIGYSEPEMTYEEWKANLDIKFYEFPHLLVGSNHKLEYVNRLIREHEMFQMMMQSQEESF
jgi:hypothetical protein